MRIRAIFKGKDNYLGYRKGVDVELNLMELPEGQLRIRRIDGAGDCIYDSFGRFLDNWEMIRSL